MSEKHQELVDVQGERERETQSITKERAKLEAILQETEEKLRLEQLAHQGLKEIYKEFESQVEPQTS